MSPLIAIAMLVFIGSCSAVGLRLLWLAKSRANLPALLCGNGFCLIAMVGFPLGVLSGQGVVSVEQVHLPLAGISLLANLLGISSFLVFAAKVFRPNALWAHTLAGAAIACAGMAAVAIVSGLALAPASASSFVVTFGWTATFQAVCLLCFSWIGVEGLAAGWRAQRQVALGLGNALVANRLVMLGVFGISSSLLCAVSLMVQMSGQPVVTSVLAQLSQGLLGAVSSGAALLAFSAPAAHAALFGTRGPTPA